MRGSIIAAALLAGVLFAGDVSAQSRALETVDQARQRNSAERWQQYERRGNQAPLGGYNDRLGSPAPYGTERPGYTSPQTYGSGGDPFGRTDESGQRGRRW